jgi:8-oxo-dGTP pyrophosphatase MutT (NUDIX family)
MTELCRVTKFHLTVSDARWAFADERRAEIAAYFAKVREANPAVWNGRVLLCRNPRAEGDVYRADYFETDFASFLAWRDWGFPDTSVFNCSGGGALRSADGAFVLGRMSAHTVNAGGIFFPSGTPDPDDVAGGQVDLAGSVAREMEEEVGLKPSDYQASEGWTVARSGQIVACLRALTSPLAAVALKQRIEAFLRSETAPELSGVKLVRSRADFEPMMPPLITAFLQDALSLCDREER